MDSRHFPRLRYLSVTLIVCFAAACSGEASSGSESVPTSEAVASAPQQGGTLIYGIDKDLGGWDPISLPATRSDLLMLSGVYEPLAIFDENDEVVPYLAESFTPNDEYTEWTVRLRPGITFSNGEAFDAASFKLLRDAWAEHSPWSLSTPYESIEVVDELTFIAHMRSPWPTWPTQMTGLIGLAIAPEQITGDRRVPIGTGPFVLDEWVPDSHLRLVRNEGYWRESLPYLDSIEFRPFADQEALRNAYRAGEIDAAYVLSEDWVAQLADDDASRLVPGIGEPAKAYVVLNVVISPTDDIRVRRALAHGLDLDAYASVTTDTGAPAEGMYGPESPWHVETSYPTFDPDEARRLIDEYEVENGPVQIKLVTVRGDPTTALQYLQEVWGNIGVDVEIEFLDFTAYILKLITGELQAPVLIGFGEPNPDMSSINMHSSALETNWSPNWARLRDEEVDRALDAATAASTPTERLEEFTALQTRIDELVPFLWLTQEPSGLILRDGIEGVGGPDGDFPNPYRQGGGPSSGAPHRLAGLWLSE